MYDMESFAFIGQWYKEYLAVIGQPCVKGNPRVPLLVVVARRVHVLGGTRSQSGGNLGNSCITKIIEKVILILFRF